MGMEFNQEQRLVKEMVRKFALAELEPQAQEADSSQQYPTENLKKMADLGLLGMTLPVSHGGSEMDSISLCIVIEEVSKACASTGSILIGHAALCAFPLFRFASDEQKNSYLPDLATGKLMGALALNEAEPESNLEGMETTATERRSSYVIDGTKTFVMNGEHAHLYVVFARVDARPGCFLVERNGGVQVTRIPYLMGMRASGISEVRLDRCEIPKANLVDADGREIAAEILDLMHLLVAAQATGIAQASLESSLKYSQERHQFGKPICHFQQVRGMLSEIAVKTAASRALVHAAARQRDAGKDYSYEASMAKHFASSTASWAAKTAVQIYGGYGYTKDFPVERYMRDAKVTEVCGTTPEMEKTAIAARLLE